MVGELTLGNHVTVAAHSLVNKSFGDNVLLVGCPAIAKKRIMILGMFVMGKFSLKELSE